jgi:hypothetical protein
MNTSEIKVKRRVSEDLAQLRGVFLDHLLAGQVVPEQALDNPSSHAEITSWEELLCAAFYPDAGRVVAVVEIHQADGYSGMLRRHGSVEYVRFFIDWGGDEGFEPISLTHFKVSDKPKSVSGDVGPLRMTLSAMFDADRYWGCVLDGIEPKVRAVLSWNQVPEINPEFSPLFGNVIDSVIRVKSQDELTMLLGHKVSAESSENDQLEQVIYRSVEVLSDESDQIL